MPDAFFGELAARFLRRSPSGPQAAGLIPRLARRVAVDSEPEARGARRAKDVPPRPELDTALMSCSFLDAVCFARGAWAIFARNQEGVLP